MILDSRMPLLLHSTRKMFITMFYGHLDLEDGELLYASAGHDPPFLCRREGVETLLTAAAALSFLPELAVHTERIAMRPGETLVLYTDGLTTARLPLGGHMGEEHVVAWVRAPPAELVAELLGFAYPKEHTLMEDDVVLIALRRPGT